MQRLSREHLFKNHKNPVLPDPPPLRVSLGEPFELETADTAHRSIKVREDATKPPGPMAGNPWTGPVYVEGVRAGDVIAVTIDDIRVDDNCTIQIDETSLLPPEERDDRVDFVPILDGMAMMPGGIRVPVRPMLGCFGVVPAAFFADPWDHGGNMDIPDIRAGRTVHIKCQRDGALFGCGDGHARQGEGEINGYSLEVSTTVRLRIDRSRYQNLQESILIENADRFVMVASAHEVPMGIRKVVWAMTRFVSEICGLSVVDAYQLVSHLADLRLGAVWPMWCTRWHIPVPLSLTLERSLIASLEDVR
jgi:amidase